MAGGAAAAAACCDQYLNSCSMVDSCAGAEWNRRAGMIGMPPVL
eukprot:CAMPEP_0202868822 /NCGR_PEP_ID=MMETSP1391-20130828/11160_1 /ASSEMBLY_ACC=CAM_ASM_000867 /TAXON_ID=1034604 /ORGANISM="Chlamydomonas leiostraca, Strain SAG 11-49" /LENGTH=43 /DNA_ID= /DNA_START= /DNA_END= /DNA_ORIENTATION=